MTVGRKFLKPLAFERRLASSVYAFVALRATYREMHVHHETEDPGAPVTCRFAQTSPNTCALTATSSIASNSVVSQLSLLRAQPACLERAVREGEEGENSNSDREGALDDKQPVDRG